MSSRDRLDVPPFLTSTPAAPVSDMPWAGAAAFEAIFAISCSMDLFTDALRLPAVPQTRYTVTFKWRGAREPPAGRPRAVEKATHPAPEGDDAPPSHGSGPRDDAPTEMRADNQRSSIKHPVVWLRRYWIPFERISKLASRCGAASSNATHHTLCLSRDGAFLWGIALGLSAASILDTRLNSTFATSVSIAIQRTSRRTCFYFIFETAARPDPNLVCTIDLHLL